MKKIKIVHLVNDFGFGGSSKVVMDLCKAFHGQEYEIHIVSLTRNIQLSRLDDWPKGIMIYPFNYYYDLDYSLKRYLILYVNRKIFLDRSLDILRCIETLQPDILHCHLQPRELIITTLLSTKVKAKLLYTDHSVRLKNGQYPAINTWMLACIYRKIYSPFHVVAVSKSVFDCHVEFNLVNRKKIHALIGNKINTLKFTPSLRPISPIRIIYVARLDKRKGQDLLLNAYSKVVAAQKIELVLVGEGESEQELKSLVSTLHLKNPVIFAGAVENVLPYLQSAHIAVFPSLQEGMPLALLEKMSCGLPVICSDIKEFQEIIVDGKNGLFFKTGDPEDLRKKLQLLVDDEHLRRRLGEGARKFILANNYDIKTLKDDYEVLYKRIIDVSL